MNTFLISRIYLKKYQSGCKVDRSKIDTQLNKKRVLLNNFMAEEQSKITWQKKDADKEYLRLFAKKSKSKK